MNALGWYAIILERNLRQSFADEESTNNKIASSMKSDKAKEKETQREKKEN